MLVECRFEMSECELGRLPRRNLRRLAQGGQGGADLALSSVESLPDAVRCGIAQSAFEASERLEFIAAAYCLPKKLPQTVGIQKQSFDFIGSPNAERSSAAGGTIPIAAEDPPSADCLLAQLLLVIASQYAVADQISNLFAMRTSRCFQLVERGIDFLLRTANPPTHDWLPSPRTCLRNGIHDNVPTRSQKVATTAE